MAAPDLGIGDAGAQQMLNDAYSQARQQNQGVVPSGLLNQLTSDQPPAGSVSVSADGSLGTTDNAPPGSTYVDEPPEGSGNPFDRAEAPKEAQAVTKQTHGSGDMWSLSNMGDFLRDEFAGTGAELKTALGRAGSKVGQFGAFGLAGAGVIADKIVNAFTGESGTPTADKIFDFNKRYIEPAIEYWTPERTVVTGEGEGSGGGAQAVGQTAEFLPKMLFGGAGAVEIAGESGISTAKGSIEQGHSLRTAAAQGAVDAVANGVQAMVPGAKLPLVKRVLVQVPAGDMAAIAGDYAKKKILEAGGHQKEADAIDPMANLGQDTLQNLIFAAMGGHKETAAGAPLPKDSTPPPEAQPLPQTPSKDTTQQAPKPVVIPPVANATPNATSSPTGAHPVGDRPSAEPAKDLQAQFADMNNKTTPRTGVLVPKGSETAAGKTLEQATAQGRVLQLDQGQLVLKNKAEFLKARAELNNSGDTEALIGRVTGAGEGKSPDQTVVVQGHTPEGAVASEGMVKPAEAPARVDQMVAEGKRPVVTSPEAAVQRRQTEIAAEKQMAPMLAESAKVEPEEEPQTPTAKRGIVQTAAGERAVVFEGEPENGRQKVRLLDDEGEPSDQVVTVASEAVKSGTETAPAQQPQAEPGAKKETQANEPRVTPESNTPAVVEPTKEVMPNATVSAAERTGTVSNSTVEGAAEKKPAAAPLVNQLRDATQDFEKSQQPPPGRKFPGSVKDRAGEVSGFARVLKSIAEKMPGKANPTDIQMALRLAKKAEGLDLKSDEALGKNQGVGHTELSVHAENMINAAKRLMDETHEYALKEPRQEKLKRQVATKKNRYGTLESRRAEVTPEPTEEPAESDLKRMKNLNPEVRAKLEKFAEKPAEKVKVMEDIPDERKAPEPTKAQQIKLKQAGEKLIRAKSDEEIDAHTADVDRILHEIYGDRMSKDDRDMFMAYLAAERRDRLRPATRDEEIEEELGSHGVDYRSAEPDEFEARILGAHEVSPEMATLHANLERSGMYPRMRQMVGKGQYGARAVYEHMASVAPEGPLRDFLTKLAGHQPEGAIIRPVDVVRNSRGEALGSAGYATLPTNDIQLLLKTGGDSRLTHALMHEGVHLATMHLMRGEPNHPLVQESRRLYDIFRDRMERRIGATAVREHIAFHRGEAARPADLINNLYGLHSPAEFMAEAMSNPKFQQLIGESEKWRDRATEGFLGGVHKLADAVVGAIQRALGMFGKRQAQLLHSVMRNVEDVMDSQKVKLDTERAGAMRDLADVAALNLDPKPLKDEPRLRGIAGRTASVLARQFYRATQGRAVPALRKLVLADETHDQIIRSNAHWFGEDNEKNPLRQYDEAMDQKNAIINRHLEKARPIVLERQKLNRADDTALGNLQNDSTRWGIDPSKDKADVATKYTKAFNFEERWNDLQQRWNALPETARHVYEMERDHYAWAQKQLRRTAVDAALDTFSDRDITPAQRTLLYSARTKGDFDSLIGSGKLVDVGDRSDSLRKSLQELAATNNISGPYFHLGRHGEYVVQVQPDVNQDFPTQHEAESYAERIRDLSPGSKAKVAEVGDKWNVEGTAQYVSMHRNRVEAEEAAQALREQGHKVGQVTQKVEPTSGGALTKATQELVSGASAKLARRGAEDDPHVKALTDALRGTLVQMVANRSAYAASKLSRAGFAGVKGEEMGRNFASHAQSMAWNIGNLATTFKQGEALGRIREMSKRPEDDVPQKTVYKRGAVMDELGKRTAQEVSQYGIRNPTNAVVAKLGYMNFLASPSHTGIYLTQNFTTAYPVAGARWGYGKALAAFTRATQAVVSPTMRATFKAARPGEFGADDMVAHVIDAIKQHPQFGKYVPQLRELMDRGIITNTFAHEVGHQAIGGNATIQRAFDYARIMPQMAEVYNRVSTALAGLEMTGGDMRKTADFINETHVNYGQSNKTRVGKFLAKVPGGNAMTMFHTYVQGMRHLLYSNIKNMVIAETKSRAEAAKTVAGLVVAMSLTAGVIKGAALEPLRGAVYAYNKVFGDSDEFYSLDNSIRRFVASAVGNKTISDAITGGLPHLLGFDLSSRMGLSDLFLHNPPDLLAADTKTRMAFLGEQLGGPMGQMVGEQVGDFQSAMAKGDAFGMLSALVPIKLLRDVGKATELAATGKRTMNGAAITKPSVTDALTQVMGFKPADVATAQARQGDVAEYRQFIDNRKTQILGAWAKATPEQKRDLRTTINDFNARNPGDRIKVQDLIKQARNAQRTQQRIETGQDRNPNIRQLLDY